MNMAQQVNVTFERDKKNYLIQFLDVTNIHN